MSTLWRSEFHEMNDIINRWTKIAHELVKRRAYVQGVHFERLNAPTATRRGRFPVFPLNGDQPREYPLGSTAHRRKRDRIAFSEALWSSSVIAAFASLIMMLRKFSIIASRAVDLTANIGDGPA